jgi:XTP/dITP diphosphohydrolase
VPPVFSAYWAGHRKDARANLELLLDQLSDIADPHRTAQFVSTIALVVPGPDGVVREETVEGVWPGRLATAPSGRAGSATTRSSCPTTRGADGRRPVGGGEERGIAPRSRLRRAGAAAEHAGAITAFIPD